MTRCPHVPVLLLLAALVPCLAACGDRERTTPAEPPLPDAVSPALASLLSEIDALPLAESKSRTAALVATEPGTLDALVCVLDASETVGSQHSRALIAIESLGPVAVPSLLDFFLRSRDDERLKRSYVALQHVLPGAGAWVSRDASPFIRRWQDADIRALAPYEARLLAVTRNGTGRARRYATLLLMGLPPDARTDASVPLLMEALGDSDAGMVSDAAYALMGSAAHADSAVPGLLHILDADVEDTRELALAILERIGKHAPAVAPAFIERAEDTEDDELRCSLLIAVSGMGEHAGGALPVLERELRGADLERSRAAGSCLRALGAAGVTVLVRVLADGDTASQIVAAQVLARTDKALVTAGVREALAEAAAADDAGLAHAARAALDALRRGT